MKKLLTSILFGFTALALLAGSAFGVYAEEEIIDLYPYDQQGCLTQGEQCTQTRVGSDNWTLEYGGVRYHAVRGSVRYAKDFKDNDGDGLINAGAGSGDFFPNLSSTSFGGIMINDTDYPVTLYSPAGTRGEFTNGSVNGMWLHFNEEGDLEMFEDFLNTYKIVNEGDKTPEGQAWRLATEAEEEEFTELMESDDDKYMDSPIRIKIEDNDQGYVLEPVKWNTNKHAWFGSEDHPDMPESTILEAPGNIELDAGYTVWHIGYLDRGNNPKVVPFLTSVPEIMLNEDTKPAIIKYNDLAPSFGDSISGLDDDAAQPGINVVVEYESEFGLENLTKGIYASYVHMFDEDGKIINEVRNADYTISIYDSADKLVEEIEMTYDFDNKKYVTEDKLTAINSDDFGASFKAVYKTVSPIKEELVNEVEIDIVVGVFPPKFENIPEVVYHTQNKPIDLLEGISANNGYGIDLTDTIEVTYPEGFSPYYPQPGTYEIGLKFVYNVFISGGTKQITLAGKNFPYVDIDGGHAGPNMADIHIYTKEGYAETVAKWSEMNWTSELIVVEDGKAVLGFSRNTNKVMNADNPASVTSDENTNKVDPTWFKTLELEDNQYAIIIKGAGAFEPNKLAKEVKYGDPIEIEIPKEDIDHDFIVETSYKLVIDDTIAPEVIVKDTVINGSDFKNVRDAILSQVVAIDNFSDEVDLLVVDNGGLKLDKAGTYTVTVKALDEAGNETVAEFDITVKVDNTEELIKDLEDQIADLEEALKDSDAKNKEELEAKLSEANDTLAKLEKDLKAKKEGTPIWLTIVIALVAAGLSFGGAVLFLNKKEQ